MGIGSMFLNIPQFKHSLSRIQQFLELEERVVEEVRSKSGTQNGGVKDIAIWNGGGKGAGDVIVNPSSGENGHDGDNGKTEANGCLENVIIVNPVLKENGVNGGKNCIILEELKKDNIEDIKHTDTHSDKQKAATDNDATGNVCFTLTLDIMFK